MRSNVNDSHLERMSFQNEVWKMMNCYVVILQFMYSMTLLQEMRFCVWIMTISKQIILHTLVSRLW